MAGLDYALRRGSRVHGLPKEHPFKTLQRIQENVLTHQMVFGFCYVSALENKWIRVGNEHLSQHSLEN